MSCDFASFRQSSLSSERPLSRSCYFLQAAQGPLCGFDAPEVAPSSTPELSGMLSNPEIYSFPVCAEKPRSCTRARS